MHENKAHIFRPYIPLKDYHLQISPWLQKINSIDKRITKYAWTRKWFRNFAENHLPDYIIPRLERLYNPPFFVDVRDIYPDSKIIYAAKPSITIVLTPGFEFKFSKVNKRGIINAIKTIQWLAFPMFENIVRLLSLHGYGSQYDIDKLIEINLQGQIFYRMTVPYKTDQERLYQNFKQCLKQLL